VLRLVVGGTWNSYVIATLLTPNEIGRLRHIVAITGDRTSYSTTKYSKVYTVIAGVAVEAPERKSKMTGGLERDKRNL